MRWFRRCRLDGELGLQPGGCRCEYTRVRGVRVLWEFLRASIFARDVMAVFALE